MTSPIWNATEWLEQSTEEQLVLGQLIIYTKKYCEILSQKACGKRTSRMSQNIDDDKKQAVYFLANLQYMIGVVNEEVELLKFL